MLRKRDTLPGRAWRCFMKIHLFSQLAPKRQPLGVPGEAVGEAVWRNGPNSLAHTGPQMDSREGALVVLLSLLFREPFLVPIWEPFW